jgi:hypothetical protein
MIIGTIFNEKVMWAKQIDSSQIKRKKIRMSFSNDKDVNTLL